VYQYAVKQRDAGLKRAVEARAAQLGFRHSELEQEQRSSLVQWQPNLTDRAQRYRANAEPPSGPKVCAFCGSRTKIMVGHLDGNESHNDAANKVWTCRSCNSLHANALKRARMGKRTAQFNPSKAGGASNLGEWAQAVGAIRPRSQGKVKGPIGSSDRNIGMASTMKTSDAVAMIRATPAHKRSEFAAKMGKHKAGRRSAASEVPF
jgi:hypothetical protein